jgi:outer membrane protein TolC
MRNRKLIILIVAAGLAAGPALAQEEVKSMSLQDCILGALKNNLSLAIQVLNPQLADESLSQAREIFMPTLSMGFNNRHSESASYSWTSTSTSGSVLTKYNSYNVSLNETIPIGGTLSLALDSYKSDTNQNLQTINPRYGSTLSLNFTQPLLRNFGASITQREILVARNNLEISGFDLRQSLLNTIYSVEQAYWNLVYSIQNLDVQRKSLELARDLLAKNQRSVEVGQLAPIEVLSAQAEVATREADILQAEVQVKNNEDSLRTLLNLEPGKQAATIRIVPTDQATFEEKPISLDEALATALDNRPDLGSARISVKNSELNLSYARNQLLPGLNLTASYSSPGISGDRLLYLNDNPLTGVVVGSIPGGASDALKDTFKFKYQNWTVGLTLDIPLSNILSQASYAQAKVNLDKALLTLKNQEQQAYLEIRTAVRSVETGYKRVQAYTVARDLAEKKYEAEVEKLKVGLSTNYTVLQNQRDLANARSAELKAIVDYNLALAGLDQALGVTLKKMNIRVQDFMNY